MWSPSTSLCPYSYSTLHCKRQGAIKAMHSVEEHSIQLRRVSIYLKSNEVARCAHMAGQEHFIHENQLTLVCVTSDHMLLGC